ncbi:LOW QUALITY PROTEIN: V-type proton ATPase 116 kDa subunit a1-like [Daphnia magna]|uniref:LOW QUALITY PROTEIN: V-type proton ATPase 116 kDa subunit a1-like n=1 Tax=Daphnia magna TaxID=35525 RepID=UPI001E1BD600|nr:LOW QUALITY PROTEIN: V-type proton ATPase 116 kDa subunit a1-like [Daphnia magna]
MSIFRSEKMSLYQLFLQNESAYRCMSELGELGCVEFRDLNSEATAFQRTFSAEVTRCNEMERKLRYLEGQIVKEDIKIEELLDMPAAPLPKEMVDLEAALDKMESELREINVNAEALNKNFGSLTEMKLTLQNAENYLADRDGIFGVNETTSAAVAPEEGMTQLNMQRFRFVTGVVSTEKAQGFERMLWRAGRGNIYLRISPLAEPLKDPVTGNDVHKSVFIAFYQGDQLKGRVKKICEGYHAALYPCPESVGLRRETSVGVYSRLQDLKTILDQTKEHRHRVLVAAAKHLRTWIVKVRKIKGIFHTLNMLSVDVTSKALVAECWIPDADVYKVRLALKQGSEASDSAFPPILNELPTNAKPPTYFRTNKFTHGFQALVNAYGIANYREVNPGLYTIITFPFLFAVMFGDGGHALIVTMFASWMCLNEEKLSKVKGEVFGIIFGGRYIILLMGIFSIYTGFIYNDFFAKAFNIFGSAWVVNYRSEGRPGEEYLIGEGSMESAMLVPDRHYDVCPNRTTSKAYDFDNATDFQSCGHYRQYPYPFGVDPVWVIAENKIVFLNSYKMKLSIILGVFHMSFGVFLNLWNFTYFKRRVSILLEFLPRILFFWPLFGYMMSLMFLKWVKYGANKEERELKSDCAPSILITFINMMLLSYSEEKTRPPNEECKTVFMFGDDEGVTQKTLQIAFVLIAVLSVPVLLFGTPIQFKMKMNRMNKAKNNYSHSGSLGSSGHGDPADREPIVNSTLHVESGGKHDVHDGHSGDYDQNQGSNDDEHNTFGDVMIYQAIHTIEYVLECISHTASYLRLWALSLAHSQLSEVLWFMVLRIGFKALPGYLGSISIFLTFAFWAGATVSILIAMEGMSAFLHTLRLHWVEFQSNFYKGEGVKFHAFHFKRVTDDAKDD